MYQIWNISLDIVFTPNVDTDEDNNIIKLVQWYNDKIRYFISVMECKIIVENICDFVPGA